MKIDEALAIHALREAGEDIPHTRAEVTALLAHAREKAKRKDSHPV